MSKLYFNEYFQIALLINDKDKTYSIFKGKLNGIKATFKYRANERRLKELYNNVKGVYERVWNYQFSNGM